jgi:uncharacterized protein (DUF488 family)
LLTLWTIGHSTHTIDEFLGILEANEIELIVDVRRFPGSRRLPQFHTTALDKSLAGKGLHYRWIPALGGRRRSSGAATPTAWRNASFQAYAEHVRSEEFAAGLEELMMVAYGLRTAIMCAEVLWWRCHRRLIADVLTSLGAEVFHIMGEAKTVLHRIAPPAAIVRGALTYESLAGPGAPDLK